MDPSGGLLHVWRVGV